MKIAKNFFALACIPALSVAIPAHAAVFGFKLADLSWTIDTDDVPFLSNSDGITYASVSTDTSIGQTITDIDFFNNTVGGGIRVTDFGTGDILGWLDGPSLYNLTQGNIIKFNTGTFALTPRLSSGLPTSITISAVPEPESWMLMIAGFGLTGMAIRRYRRRRIVTAITA